MIPIEYKLIPFPKNEGEWLIISEKDVTYKTNDKLLGNNGIETVHLNNGNNFSVEVRIDDRKQQVYSTKIIGKIIASSIEIDESIPLIRKEQIRLPEIGVDKAIDYAERIYTDCSEDNFVEFNAAMNGFESGYNKHAETHPFTLEDMKTLLDICTKAEDGLVDYKGSNFIQSLQQPKKEYIIELEMEVDLSSQYNGYRDLRQPSNNLKLKIDSGGYINILSIK